MGRIGFILLFLYGAVAQADLSTDHLLTVIRQQGRARVLKYPAAEPSGPGPFVKWQGQHYTVMNLKTGDTIAPGNIIQSDKGAGVTLLFNNGDYLGMAGNTALTYQKTGTGLFHMYYGRIRVVLQRSGIRRKFRQQSRDVEVQSGGCALYMKMIAGVGTDVLSLRGQCEVRSRRQRTAMITLQKGQAVFVQRSGKLLDPRFPGRSLLREARSLGQVRQSAMNIPSPGMQYRVGQLEKHAFDSLLHEIRFFARPVFDEIMKARARPDNLPALLAFEVDTLFADAIEDHGKGGATDDEPNLYQSFFHNRSGN